MSIVEGINVFVLKLYMTLSQDVRKGTLLTRDMCDGESDWPDSWAPYAGCWVFEHREWREELERGTGHDLAATLTAQGIVIETRLEAGTTLVITQTLDELAQWYLDEIKRMRELIEGNTGIQVEMLERVLRELKRRG